MAPSRKDKGKGKYDEGSSAPDPLNLGRLVDTPREKKLLLNFRNRHPPPKYGDMSTFPSLSFDFTTLFHFQGLDTLIAELGSIYPDLVRSFYANLYIGKGCIFSSRVKGKEIVLTMEEFGKFLDVPSEGERTCHGYNIDWPCYNKINHYFSISRLTEHEINNKRSHNIALNRLILSTNNPSVIDRMLHYFIYYILMPKHSIHSQTNDTEMQIIYAVKNNLKVN